MASGTSRQLCGGRKAAKVSEVPESTFNGESAPSSCIRRYQSASIPRRILTQPHIQRRVTLGDLIVVHGDGYGPSSAHDDD